MEIVSYKDDYTATYFNDSILNEFYSNGIDCWLAGGCIRDYFMGVKPVDYDMYFPNETEFKKAKELLNSKGAVVKWESENGMKLETDGITLDLVKIYTPNPLETIQRFDFTACMFAVYHNELLCGNTSFSDLQNRKLVINHITYPESTLKRAFRYYTKGFTISSAEASKLYSAIKKLPDQTGEGDDFLNFASSGDNTPIVVPPAIPIPATPNPPPTPKVKPVAEWDSIPYILAGIIIALSITSEQK